jgi:glyoxylase-like metal-dependent hydrolase (beta-lactamase superfamily II)
VYLQVLGIGGAFTARHSNTAFFVSAPDVRLLIDGPQGLLRLLVERGIAADQITGVVMTHVHPDHAAGMALFVLWRRYVLGRRTPLYTSRRVYDHLERRFFPAFAETFTDDLTGIVSTRFEDFVDWYELPEEGVTRLSDGVGLEIRHNWHPVPTLGLRIHLGGRVIGVSGDHCFQRALLRRLHEEGRIDGFNYDRMAGPWLWESDLVYHEAAADGAGGHTPEEELLQFPREVQAKIRLVHVADDFRGTLPVAVEGERAVVGADGFLRLELPATIESS